MNHTYRNWKSLATKDIDATVHYIATNQKASNVTNSLHIIEKFILPHSGPIKVLDFGCGVGRNAIPLASKYPEWEIVCYDSIEMTDRMEEYCTIRHGVHISAYNNIRIENDWSKLKKEKFDYIYAILVLQHIYEKDLSQYLSDIKNMTPKFIVHGRRFNDEIINGQYKNTWEILEKNNLFPDDTTGYSVSGNKSDHHSFVYSIKGQ